MQTCLMHNESGQKQHDKGLAAAGCAEVGAALAVSGGFAVRQQIGEQFSRGEILRIARNDLHVFAVVGIGKIDEVVNDVAESFLAEHSLYHGVERINAVRRTVGGFDTPP